MAVHKLSSKHAAAILALFYMGSALHMPTGLGTDGWIAYLAGLLIVMPLLLILARLVRLMPEMNLYDMLEYTLGKALAVIVGLFYFLYFIAWAAVARVYYGTFVQQTSLTRTPLIVILLILFVLCIYLARSGVATVGKWSILLGAVVLFGAVLLTLLAIPDMRLEHLLPIAARGSRAIARGGYRQALWPFGGAVVMLAVLRPLDRKANPYAALLFGAAIACGFFVLNFLRDTAVLGETGMDTLRYPSFQTAGVVRMGVVETRIEFLTALPLILAGLTKAAVCLLAAAGAVARIFRNRDRQSILFPAALFSVGLSVMLLYSREAALFVPTFHQSVAPLFQAVIPVLVWLIAEGKHKRKPMGAEK